MFAAFFYFTFTPFGRQNVWNGLYALFSKESEVRIQFLLTSIKTITFLCKIVDRTQHRVAKYEYWYYMLIDRPLIDCSICMA